MNVKEIRRENLRVLAQHAGGIAGVARRLKKSTSQMSHLIGPNPIKNIGDRIAAEIESIFNKPSGWLDHIHVGNDQNITQVDVENNSGKLPITMVPILSWEAAQHWPNFAKYSKNVNSSLPILNHKASGQAFALIIENDLMQSPEGVSFAKGSMIIVDTDKEIANNHYVLVRTKRHPQLLFRQLVIDGDRHYLKPLNPRYPITAAPNDAQYLGVVTQTRMDI